MPGGVFPDDGEGKSTEAENVAAVAGVLLKDAPLLDVVSFPSPCKFSINFWHLHICVYLDTR